jgi:pimeloyl-ACP methyl ester carboxylesterase
LHCWTLTGRPPTLDPRAGRGFRRRSQTKVCIDDHNERGALACHVEGSGRPLVLFHGGIGSWTHWIRNISALHRRFTVFAPDLPGCGDSLSVPDDIAKDDYMAIVYAAVEEIAGAGTISLAGFSFGGGQSAADRLLFLSSRVPS